MPEIGETVEGVITGVAPDRREGWRRLAGHATVECAWGTYNLVNGTPQGVPPALQVVGGRVRLRWGRGIGGYCGPMVER